MPFLRSPAHYAAALVAIIVAQTARAQFSSNFEFPTCYSGEYLTGQDGWAVSVGSLDFNVIDLEGNFLNIPPSPQSGLQFAYGMSGCVVVLGQFTCGTSATQHPVTFTTGGTWTATWDIAMTYTGTGTPGTGNMGGVSLLGGTRTFTTRSFWTSTAGTAWNSMFVPANAAGVAASTPVLPDPAFGNLLARHWYRESVSWSFDSNLITSVSITDLSTGVQTTVTPTGWYLGGGAAPSGALPTQFRLGTVGAFGPVAAYDNISLTFHACPVDFNHDGSITVQDIFDFLNAWFAGDLRSDFNGVGGITEQDLFDFLDAWFAGCP
ncbi:MAG TPA: GC-type dockerin domain-anchored protein [Phycisphaerales bacterium]|nr:GC-type dockerin domain-anchored protein [Phycisphaerales bacterium]